MKLVSYVFTVIGILLYLAALVYSRTTMGEILSDAGNAIFLIAALILLFRIDAKLDKSVEDKS